MSGQTDRQTDKSSRWQFTAYEPQWGFFTTMPPGVAEWGWNTEICPETNRKHYQGYLRLTQQQRFAWLRKLIPGVHVEVAKNWDALVNYCKKEDTRAPGTTPVYQVNTMYNKYTYAERVGKWLVEKHKQGIWETWMPNELHNAIERVVSEDITNGRREIAWIIVSPDWKLFWKSYKYILRSHSIDGKVRSVQEGNEEGLPT